MTFAGSVLGLGLLADTSPSASHHGRRGQRLVTASLTVHWCPDADREGPSSSRIVHAGGTWPWLVATGRIQDRSGALVATSRATFAGFERRGSGHAAPGKADPIVATGALDEAARRLADEITAGWRSISPTVDESAMRVSGERRNRFGPMHGGVVFAALALLALRRDAGAAVEGGIVDSHVRFLRPLTADRLVLRRTTIRRSARLIDVETSISAPGEEEVALGRFLVTADAAEPAVPASGGRGGRR